MNAVVPRRRKPVLPVVTATMLAASALLPSVQPGLDAELRNARTVLIASAFHHWAITGFPLIVVLLAGMFAGIQWYGLTRLARRSYPIFRLLMYLWPVGLLTILYPSASRRMAGHAVGGVPLTTFLLAVALTVPWVSQGMCLPLYRVLGAPEIAADRAAAGRRFCAIWPTTLAQTVPVLIVCAAPLRFVRHWSPAALGAYVLLVALDVAFAQSLVLTNIRRSQLGWALAWTVYITPVLIVPWAWYLPPLLGLLSQVVPLGRQLRTRPAWLAWPGVAADLLRGLLLGSVLWADKFLYFIRVGAHFPVVSVFLALLPAVLGYNYYFICLAPTLDASVARLRTAMENEPIARLPGYSRELAESVLVSLKRTALLGAVAVFITSFATAATQPSRAPFAASVSLAAWLFMMITILCYKLDYGGLKVTSQLLSAAHLLVAGGAFLLLPTGTAPYICVAAADLVLFALLLHACRRAWRAPEYMFFWRHALAW